MSVFKMGAGIALIAALIGVTSYLVSGKSDNPIEQASERVIEDSLGLPKDSVDLTPGDDKEKDEDFTRKVSRA